MSVFRLKQMASNSAHAAAGAIRWNYDRAELIADGIVHGIGVFSGLIAATVLIVLAGVFASAYQVALVSVYAAGLLAMLGFSAAYNLWPVSRRKWLLRRFDHAAIYILIAATYTPIFAKMPDRAFAMSLLAGVWGVAAVGILLKLFFPAAATGVLVSYRRWPALQFRGNLPRMAAASLSERDLAFLRAVGRGVPLHRRAQSRAGLTAISKTQVPPCR